MEDFTLQFKNNINLASNLYPENKQQQYENLYKECYPVVNYTDRSSDFIVDLFAPGFQDNELKVFVDNGILKVEGRQLYSGSHFLRSIQIPKLVDSLHCSYQIKNGHVKVIFPIKSQKPSN